VTEGSLKDKFLRERWFVIIIHNNIYLIIEPHQRSYAPKDLDKDLYIILKYRPQEVIGVKVDFVIGGDLRRNPLRIT
jgi:hypothetical protein